jgi:RimJ/RimL family protein N-acetyltransferase
MSEDPTALAFVTKSFPWLAERNPEQLFSRFANLDDPHCAWAVEDERGHLVGHIELKPTPKVKDDERELIYLVRHEARGAGVATEAVRLALLSPALDLVSAIVAFVNPQNAASRRVLEKVGFRSSAENDFEYRYAFVHAPPATYLRIRDASSVDRDAIVAIDAVAGADPQRVAFIDRSMSESLCVVAESREGVVGYAVLDYSFFASGFIALVYVAEPARRRGVGTALTGLLESRCTTPKVFTSTNRSNLPMQRLLEKLNYQPSGVIYNLDVDDPELVYVKFLPGVVVQGQQPT